MTEDTNNEPDNLNAKYIKLLAFLKEKQATLTPENIEELLKEADILFEQIQKPSTLKIDAQIMSHSSKFSNTYLSKQLRNTELSVQIFLELIKNNSYQFFVECNKKYNKGVTFCKYLSLECEEKKSLSRSITRSVVDTEPEIPKTLDEQNEEKSSLTDKIEEVVKKYKNIRFVNLVIDPKSYPKTIENIFYTAFAVRRGLVGLCIIESELYVQQISEKTECSDHLIFDITYDEYKEIINKYKITKAHL
ncbi:Non-structural maintenance of chromosomes element 4 A [Binucleata daphniae]